MCFYFKGIYMSFPYTPEGYLEAKEYLKDLNIKELSDDGYTIVALANSLLEKEELNQKNDLL